MLKRSPGSQPMYRRFTPRRIRECLSRHQPTALTQQHNDAVYGYFLGQARAGKLRSPESLARQLTLLTLGAMITAHTGRQGDVAGRDAREAALALIAGASE